MDAYSQDLRDRVAAACDQKVLTQAEIAEEFGVSVSFITKLLKRRRDTGSLAALPHAGGFASAIDAVAERDLRALVKAQPDATLEELAGRLAQRPRPVRRSVSVISRALIRLKLPRKKRRSTPPSATPRGFAAAATVSSAKSRRFRRPGAW